MVISYPIFGILQALMFGVGNLDLMYFNVSTLQLKGLQDSLCFNILRHLHLHIYTQWMLLSARACILIPVGMTLIFFQILVELKTYVAFERFGSFYHHSYKIYQELRIVICLLWGNINTVLGNSLAIGFLMNIFGTCGSILTFRLGYKIVPLVLFGISASLICGILVGLKMSCFLFKTSNDILCKWVQNRPRWNSRLYLRVVRACQPLYVKAGNVAVITEKLQAEYLFCLVREYN